MKSGTVVSTTATSILYTPDDGSADKTCTVAGGATVTLNGKTAKLTDLKRGDKISFGGEPATSVTATR
jgi:hypothetical protein